VSAQEVIDLKLVAVADFKYLFGNQSLMFKHFFNEQFKSILLDATI